MIEYLNELFTGYGFSDELSVYLSNAIAILLIIALCVIVMAVTKKLLLKMLEVYISKSKNKWDDVFLKNKVFARIAGIVPAIIVHESAALFPAIEVWIKRIAFSYIIFAVLMALYKIVDSVDDIYRQHDISKVRPIKGYLQVVKIFFTIAAAIITVSALMDRSPLILLSGFGAATAVIMLIFQNSILGLVASIQLATNNMIQIGDWIEMPSHGADGDVIEITLHTVKVQNWDKTIVTIPPHALITESFKNWKGMHESGGRRIKRCIYIDMSSIRFCDEEMLAKLKKIQYLKEYIEKRTAEIEKYNREMGVDPSSTVNGRRMTNIGTFRAYIQSYINHHPNINHNMTAMVRQLQSGENGLPIEVYAFTNTTQWVQYEGIQADIFDHILAVAPEFDIKIYQNPTGNDLGRLQVHSGMHV
ncbi:MAG: mechanosensitive ion channel [Clostridiaceae bacterium]|jgi:miniconductance mechanosensitive channel|nr:mechanosensitive ion channel [Clostridiaceae bacterium]